MRHAALSLLLALLLSACAPQREFVRFRDAGTFHPGPQSGGQNFSGPEGEYDSYELIDHGTVPNHGIPPMYSQDPYGAYGYPTSVGYPNRW